MEAIYKDIVKLLTSTGPWLSKKWAWVLPLTGVLIALLLVLLNLVPTIPDKDGEIVFQYYKWGVILGLPLFLFLFWLIGTQLYLRTGSGVKIGVAYENYKIDITDWKHTKAILKDLFRDEQLRNRISLRFVPLRATEVEKIGKRFSKRYSFTILFSLQQSDTNDPIQPYRMSISLQSGKQALPYIKTTLQNSLAIHAVRSLAQNKTPLDILRNKALNLHDMVLLFVATHNFVTGHYEDASVILRHIDGTLEGIFAPMQQPRFSIRELDARCCVDRLAFPIESIPPHDELERMLQFADKGMRYFDDFGFVYSSIARAKFLYGDVDSALALTHRCNQVIETLQKKGDKINQSALSTLYLNYGFLYFILGQWHNSYNSFQKLFQLADYQRDDWSSLVDFVDYVHSLECYEGTPFLQVLYRKAAGHKIPPSMNQSALQWLQIDGSRRALGSLLHRSFAPSGSRQPAQKCPAKKKKRPRKRRSITQTG